MNAMIRITSVGTCINCPTCGKRIIDGNLLLARVTKLGSESSQAKCPRCKQMVKVPVCFTPAVAKAPAGA